MQSTHTVYNVSRANLLVPFHLIRLVQPYASEKDILGPLASQHVHLYRDDLYAVYIPHARPQAPEALPQWRTIHLSGNLIKHEVNTLHSTHSCSEEEDEHRQTCEGYTCVQLSVSICVVV